ncbi:hypothetical protein K227x_04890 [Rubripirellula lacrimiformis]|uniref:DUF4404 domain-containing protein n=1 Tax=Rubripirellula lacrimiformis TaxID=1930273 RepID=A0A517N519_9BACT|nr:DUF4404 family protein [Rubripirellula lacrimiformis]QDT02118.1 hypothetical protein K227x_04890 [Rubripirellula lacrimiformis]
MPESLQHTLRQLHEQLKTLDELDPTEREQLETAVQEIQDSLDRFDIKSSDLAKRFHESTEKFSSNYPHLTQTAGQFADMLAQMGI